MRVESTRDYAHMADRMREEDGRDTPSFLAHTTAAATNKRTYPTVQYPHGSIISCVLSCECCVLSLCMSYPFCTSSYPRGSSRVTFRRACCHARCRASMTNACIRLVWPQSGSESNWLAIRQSVLAAPANAIARGQHHPIASISVSREKLFA